jgi:hypothetical protein
MTTSDTTDRTAVVVLSDPEGGGDEALGRTFNALALALDLDQAGQDVQVIFQGAGTSCSCAQLFGAEAGVTACGINLLTDNKVPGTDGVAGLRSLIEDGRRILIF